MMQLLLKINPPPDENILAQEKGRQSPVRRDRVCRPQTIVSHAKRHRKDKENGGGDKALTVALHQKSVLHKNSQFCT